jgi:hypothetical protein
MCNKCNDFEKRIERLESIITPHSLTLINKQDPNEAMVLICDGEFKSKKVTKTITEEELGSTQGF